MTKKNRIEQLHQYLDYCMEIMVSTRKKNENREFVLQHTKEWLDVACAVISYERVFLGDITFDEADELIRMVTNVFDNCNNWDEFEEYED